MRDGKINWLNTIFFNATAVLSIVALAWMIRADAIQTPTVIFAVVLLYLSGMSITGGYHRCFSHQTYRASKPLRFAYLFFATMAVQGSALEWCTDHRDHHLYTDTDKDPYNAKRGFWYSHIGWLFRLDMTKRNFDNVKDLAADPMMAFQHHFFPWLVVLANFIFPMCVAMLWSDPLGGLLIAGLVRMFVNHHFTFFINSLAHIYGKQTYSDACTAKDNWLLSLLTYGEGFHNFHHLFARDYRNGVRWFHFDPTKWLIFLLSKLKLASHLSRVPESKIVSYRMAMMAKNAKKRYRDETLHQRLDDLLRHSKARVTALGQQLDAKMTEYAELKHHRVDNMRKRMHSYQLKLNRLKRRELKKELMQTIDAFQDAISRLQSKATS